MININIYLLLIIQVLVGAVFYIGVSVILKLDSFQYILDIIKNMFKGKKTAQEVK